MYERLECGGLLRFKKSLPNVSFFGKPLRYAKGFSSLPVLWARSHLDEMLSTFRILVHK